MNDHFKCYFAERDADGHVSASIRQLPMSDLPDGEVLVGVEYSSLNYKDALAATGHPGVARRLPHIPGIDAVGVVSQSADDRFSIGQRVIVTGYELGAGHWGGWSELIHVPGDWVVPLPEDIDFATAMAYGTAGFTAAQCVREIIRNEIDPPKGRIVVTGATGGVGCLAVAILAKLGYQVSAVTGKRAAHSWLRDLGASEILDRAEVLNDSTKPLGSIRFAGGVDTVGGETLASVIRATDVNGCVTACGLVGGADLPTTVYPFILRGVRLIGITSALCPMNSRLDVWNKLANEWSVSNISAVVTEITLEDLDTYVDKILRGEVQGRTVVKVAQ